MKFLRFIFLFIVYSNFCFGQNLDSLYVSKINDTIASKILLEKRAFEIQLPRSFDKDDKIKYPLMIIMDGDHLFNMVSGTVDYLSYWGDIPEGEQIARMRSEFMTRFEPGQGLIDRDQCRGGGGFQG